MRGDNPTCVATRKYGRLENFLCLCAYVRLPRERAYYLTLSRFTAHLNKTARVHKNTGKHHAHPINPFLACSRVQRVNPTQQWPTKQYLPLQTLQNNQTIKKATSQCHLKREAQTKENRVLAWPPHFESLFSNTMPFLR